MLFITFDKDIFITLSLTWLHSSDQLTTIRSSRITLRFVMTLYTLQLQLLLTINAREKGV